MNRTTANVTTTLLSFEGAPRPKAPLSRKRVNKASTSGVLSVR
jgi:hypothetical protein